MLIAKNDEAKRSRIWRIVTTVSSVLIVLIAIFLLTKLFTTNPLEGSWKDEDGNVDLRIRSGGKLTAVVPELGEAADVEVRMSYTIDRDKKTLAIHQDEAEIKKAVEKSEGKFTEEALDSAVSMVVNTFDYSVDQEKLTLTEREYGEQMRFIKE